LFIISYAQEIDKTGSILLNGSIGFSYTSSNNALQYLGNENLQTYNLNMNPKVGYFLNNKMVAGLGLDFVYTYAKIKTGNTSYNVIALQSSQSLMYYVEPFFRYYFINNWFGEASVLLGHNNTIYKYQSPSYNYSTGATNIGTGLTFGYSWFVKPNVCFEPFLKYSHNYSGSSGGNGLLFSLGLSYLLSK